MIYLDNNATTPLAPEVKAAMLPYFDSEFGNPSSHNAFGRRAKEAVMAARERVAEALGASVAEVVFTSGATESNHVAILSGLDYFAGRRRGIVASRVEHPSTLALLAGLRAQGAKVTLLDVDEDGNLALESAAAAIDSDTALVTLMWANNETGVIFPVEEIARLAKSRGALFHTDAVQAVGRLPLCWQESSIDLLSLSGHKLHAPKGVGAFLTRRGLRLPPLFYGSQERNRRGGTENVMGIVGLGAAMSLLRPINETEALREILEDRITRALPMARVNGARAKRVANTSNISFGNLHGEALLMALEREGVVASLGSACQSGGNHPSHVLSAMGLSETAAKSSLRFSLSRHTRRDEIERAGEIVVTAAEELLRQSILQT